MSAHAPLTDLELHPQTGGMQAERRPPPTPLPAPEANRGGRGEPNKAPKTDGAPASHHDQPSGDAFTAVYTRELSWVWRTLWRLGVRDADLEDAAHDVFVVVHRKLADYDPARPLRPWLFGISFRVALDRRRRAHVRHEQGAEMDEHEHQALGPERVVEQRQARAVVERALFNLPLEQRAVFVLHELDGVSIPDCQEILQAPVNTLYSRLRLARVAFAATVKAMQRTP